MKAPTGLDAFDVPLETLRARRSAKWATYPDDVLPAWVAEMDFELAPPIRAVLLDAIELDDTGYAEPGRLGSAFAGFASARFGWSVEPERVWVAADVMSAAVEVLRSFTSSGDGVVVNTPVYPPFLKSVPEIGRRVVEVPLVPDSGRWELDLDGLERAFAGGAAAYLLCNPHNPTGRLLGRDELAAVAELAARHGVLVVADEVHGPMALPGATHTPFVSLGEEAAAHGVTITSASKAWNLAGLKCAVIVAGSAGMQEQLAERLPKSLRFHAGHFGVLASVAAFTEGAAWLDALIEHLDGNRRRLGELLERELPAVRYAEPEAGFLAWLDCRELGLGDDPSAPFLERGRVAVNPGPTFGSPGRGFVRLNFGTSSSLLEEAVRRMASTLDHA
jgi:cystathionine beta-lyase